MNEGEENESGWITIYTDGSYYPDHDVGAWACLIRYPNGDSRLLSQSPIEPSSSHNRMELHAAIEALAAIPLQSKVSIYTDSQYVFKGITEWLPKRWKLNGFHTAAGASVKNVELWEKLERYVSYHNRVVWQWIKGHDGNPYHDRVDNAARQVALAAVKRVTTHF